METDIWELKWQNTETFFFPFRYNDDKKEHSIFGLNCFYNALCFLPFLHAYRDKKTKESSSTQIFIMENNKPFQDFISTITGVKNSSYMIYHK